MSKLNIGQFLLQFLYNTLTQGGRAGGDQEDAGEVVFIQERRIGHLDDDRGDQVELKDLKILLIERKHREDRFKPNLKV